MTKKEKLLNEVKNRLVVKARNIEGSYGGQLVVDWETVEQVIDQLKSDD